MLRDGVSSRRSAPAAHIAADAPCSLKRPTSGVQLPAGFPSLTTALGGRHRRRTRATGRLAERRALGAVNRASRHKSRPSVAAGTRPEAALSPRNAGHRPRENHDLFTWAGELGKRLTQLPSLVNPGPVSDAVSLPAPALTPENEFLWTAGHNDILRVRRSVRCCSARADLPIPSFHCRRDRPWPEA